MTPVSVVEGTPSICSTLPDTALVRAATPRRRHRQISIMAFPRHGGFGQVMIHGLIEEDGDRPAERKLKFEVLELC